MRAEERKRTEERHDPARTYRSDRKAPLERGGHVARQLQPRGERYGVAPEEEDENFDFEEALRDIRVELEDLNAEAARLAETIKKNFEELGV